jgi:ribosomal-protein-serine acetyltransferase
MNEKPILMDVPDRIETARLELRAVSSGSGAAVNAGVVDSHAEVSQWMPWANPCPKVEDTEEWCRTAAAYFVTRKNLHYHFFLKGTETFAGTISLFNIVWSVPRFEIGYWLRTCYVGNGYMTEAARALERMAFETLQAERIEIRCDERNGRSAAVAERLGFALEATFRHDMRDVKGELRNTRIYVKIRR